MTEADRSQFTLRVVELARGRAKRLDPQHKTEDRELLDGLFSLLDDVPWPKLDVALAHSAKHARYFPDVPSIRQALTEVAAKTSHTWPTRAAMADGDRYCDLCDDTGWEPCTIDASHVYGPGKTAPAVRRCVCRDTNPIYRAKRDAERPIAAGRRED